MSDSINKTTIEETILEKKEDKGIDFAVDNLIEAIKKDDSYKRYAKQKSIVYGSDELKGKIERLHVISNRIDEISGIDNMEGEYDYLMQEYENLYYNNHIHTFLQAEIDFYSVFKKTLSSLMTLLD